MTTALTIVTVLIGLAVAVPVVVFIVECLLAFLPPRPHVAAAIPQARPRLGVIIPAHNEAAGLGATLASVLEQTLPGDRVVVVADNCTDATADVARQYDGVEVVERFDEERRGKSYALAAGMDALRRDPPAVVVLIDADCLLKPDALGRLAAVAGNGGFPVQGAYVLEPVAASQRMGQISTFAFLVKNVVRQRGLHTFQLPALLQGTGMAFPWMTLDAVDLARHDLVEDLSMGLDLLAAGHPATFCLEAGVTSRPADSDATLVQRTRWEQGYLTTMLTRSPKLIAKGLLGRPGLLAVGLDLAVPPLSLLAFLFVAAWGLSVVNGAAAGVWWPAWALTALGLLLGLTVLAVALRFGRGVIDLKTLALAPAYAVWKFPIYAGMVTGPQTQWVRTARASVPDNHDGPTPPPPPADERDNTADPTGPAARPHDASYSQRVSIP